MFSIPEQFSAATKANFDAQLALITALTGKAFESVEKFVDLNMTVAKTSLEESTAAAKQLFSAKDPQEFFSLSAAQAQPNAEKAIAYSRHLATIASSTQAEFTKAAETQIAETNRKVLALIEEVSKNAPAGSENVVALFKTAIGNANASYDHLTKTTKQAVEALEANLSTAVTQISQAAVKAAPRAAKK
ncbi:TIGR01841 family phasin [Undibacterium sp. TJN25]|uniref:TIGR01841 family phasin n=1 Tax=Undibacterium sp. TJN25 TaxID=3413056 RepID=UPI003BF17E7E